MNVTGFWARVTKTDGCWSWAGERNAEGYGVVRFNGRRRTAAHRVAYELLVGPLADGMSLDHLCRNRGCVNPGHLEPVSHRENVLRGISFSAANAAKTRCVNGHEFTPENTYVTPKGHRMCRACAREYRRRYRRRLAQGVA